MDILQRRFAEGAITAEEYEERRKLLADSGAAAPVEPASKPATSQTGAA